MNNMLIRPTEEQLANFGEPDFVIYNAGEAVCVCVCVCKLLPLSFCRLCCCDAAIAATRLTE